MKPAVCYITDSNYLDIAIISAVSVAQTTPSLMGSIFILTVDVSGDKTKPIADSLRTAGVQLLQIAPVWRGKYNAAEFRSAHITDATLGRVYLAEFLPDDVDRIIYIDCDTIITKDIGWLASFELKPSEMGAVADASFFYKNLNYSIGHDWRGYISSLPVKLPAYFNAGVLVAYRETWSSIMTAAFSFLVENTRLCHHHDQTALNIVGVNRLTALPSAFNYQPNHFYLGMSAKTARIHHFCGALKPWRTSAWPMAESSRAFVRIANELELVGSAVSPKADLRMSIRHLGKISILWTLHNAEMRIAREEMLDYESKAHRQML